MDRSVREKAFAEVERLNQDPELRELVRRRELALERYQIDLGTAHEQGVAKGKAEAVLEALEARGLPVTDADRARILGCCDLPTLRAWHRRAVMVASTNDVFAD